jgi:hypothetical protein
MGKKWSKDEDEILYSSVSRVGKSLHSNSDSCPIKSDGVLSILLSCSP